MPTSLHRRNRFVLRLCASLGLLLLAPRVTSAAPESSPTVVAGGITFAMDTCELTGGNVRCTIKMRTAEDRHLDCQLDHIRLFDDASRVYYASELKVANTVPKFGHTQADIVGGTVAEFVVTFSNVSPGAQLISKLEIKCENNMTVQFRALPLVH